MVAIGVTTTKFGFWPVAEMTLMTRLRHWLCAAAMDLLPVSALSKYSPEPIGCRLLGLGSGMRRRAFLGVLAGAAAWPLSAHAQQSNKVRLIGVLMAGSEADPEVKARVAAFHQGLADLGWKDGQNVQIEYRWANGKAELIRQYAEELVARAPDMILANSTPVTEALKKITSSIPIVFALATDPVGLALVKGLAHPGGNITGFSFIEPELIGKWTGLLKDVMPNIARAALLFNPSTAPFYTNLLHEIEATRQPGGTELVPTPVGTLAEMETAINALSQKQDSGLMLGPDPFITVNIKQIAQLAGKNQLPAISVFRQFAVEGGLMTYGPDTVDVFRRSADYVDRILKGANPADLPVQTPIKFQFVINIRTAKSFGLVMSPALLDTADEVIE
jgi:putative ABC transport system substrate-binding protein